MSTLTTGSTSAAFRPPQWSAGPAMYSITVVNPAAKQGTATIGSVTGSGSTSNQYLVFDAVMRASHEQSAILTRHPLQTGFNVSDAIVLQQAGFELEVAMSDVMASYSSGMWTGNSSKSVSAFQQMKQLIAQKSFLTVTTRLYTYSNCVLVNMRAVETSKTFRGAAMILSFEQPFVVQPATQGQSARPDATDTTNQGQVQTGPLSDTQQNIYGVPTAGSGGLGGNDTVPGAGVYSSNPVYVRTGSQVGP